MEQIVSRVMALAEKTARSPATISRKVFGNGTRLDELKAGGGMNLRSLPAVHERLAQLENEAA